ncbi:MAG TPA: HAD family hydrolase [Anaerovoracaceae bacterium]|nr:HAD family hydrolase [Anaerovoracaceae bacterium]
MLPYPKTILFDLDDTLIEGAAGQAWEKCCSDFINRYKFSYDIADLLESINTARQWYWSDQARDDYKWSKGISTQ